MKKEIIIVGAGFSGATVARKLAEKNYKVKIIEKRNHIAGNMYDEIDKETNGLYHVYGPHIFHTDNEEVMSFLEQFSDWEGYNLRTQVLINGRFFSCPFNFETIDTIYDFKTAVKLKDLLLKEFEGKEFATVTELLSSNSKEIRDFANFLWENDYKLYTSKQWGISPEDVDPNILKRVPIYLNYKNKIHNNKYEGFPVNGYSNLFKNLLNHENIEVVLEEDAIKYINFSNNDVLWKKSQAILIFSGAIDELFNYKFGELNYRSLIFQKNITKNNTQINRNTPAVDIYPELKYEYTRITNYGYLLGSQEENQISSVEFSHKFDKNNKNLERYYPINTEDDKKKYSEYLEYSKKYNNLYLCGRLADYKYYDMDKAIERALSVSKEILTNLKGEV